MMTYCKLIICMLLMSFLSVSIYAVTVNVEYLILNKQTIIKTDYDISQTLARAVSRHYKIKTEIRDDAIICYALLSTDDVAWVQEKADVLRKNNDFFPTFVLIVVVIGISVTIVGAKMDDNPDCLS